MIAELRKKLFYKPLMASILNTVFDEYNRKL